MVDGGDGANLWVAGCRLDVFNSAVNKVSHMSARIFTFTPHQEILIDALLKSGRYGDASEVVREGLRLVETREAEDVARLEALRTAVDIGIAAMDRGEYWEFANAAELVTHLRRASDAALSTAADTA